MEADYPTKFFPAADSTTKTSHMNLSSNRPQSLNSTFTTLLVHRRAVIGSPTISGSFHCLEGHGVSSIPVFRTETRTKTPL